MVNKEIAEHYIWGERCDGWHLLKRADLSVIQERMPPNTSEVRHYHNKSRQFFYVLRGTATIEVNNKREIVQANEGIEVPPTTPHQIFNETDQDIEFLVISQPAGHGDRINVDND